MILHTYKSIKRFSSAGVEAIKLVKTFTSAGAFLCFDEEAYVLCSRGRSNLGKSAVHTRVLCVYLFVCVCVCVRASATSCRLYTKKKM